MGTCCQPEEYDGDGVPPSYKILFLGTGGCGKSTIVKQYKKLYGEGFTNKDKKDAIHGIAALVVEVMQILLENESINIDNFKSQDARRAALNIQCLITNPSTSLTDDTALNIKLLWKEPQIKYAFHHTVRFYLHPVDD